MQTTATTQRAELNVFGRAKKRLVSPLLWATILIDVPIVMAGHQLSLMMGSQADPVQLFAAVAILAGITIEFYSTFNSFVSTK